MIVHLLARHTKFLRLSGCARKIDLRSRHGLPGLLVLLIGDAISEVRLLNISRARCLRTRLSGHLLLMHLLDQLTLMQVLSMLLRESRTLVMILVLMEQLLGTLEALARRRHRVTYLMLLHGQTVQFLRALPLKQPTESLINECLLASYIGL